MVVLRSKAGFPPDLESTRMWEASLENAKQPPFGICDIRSIWLQVPSFPRARPRMCRREDWVAALSLIEAHSHTLKSRTEASRMVRGGKRSSVRGALTRAPLSPRCTALSVASCGNHGAAPNSGTRVPGNLGGKFMGLKLKAKKHKRTLFSKSFRKVASKVALTLLFRTFEG